MTEAAQCAGKPTPPAPCRANNQESTMTTSNNATDGEAGNPLFAGITAQSLDIAAQAAGLFIHAAWGKGTVPVFGGTDVPVGGFGFLGGGSGADAFVAAVRQAAGDVWSAARGFKPGDAATPAQQVDASGGTDGTAPMLGADAGAAGSLPATPGATTPTSFGFTGQVVDYTVPEDGTYLIVATGAQGGTETHRIGSNSDGGTGERVRADFDLTAGEVLHIAVGGKGGDGPTGVLEYGAAGGGGGTFVVGPGDGVDSLLLVAGGGGGGGAGKGQDGLSPESLQAQDGVSSKAPNGSGVGGGAAGSNGLGGTGGDSDYYPNGGGGGSGFVGNGAAGGSQGNAGGSSFANGLGGGGSGHIGGGGFGGGGGGGHGDEYAGGGGGGGYNGGGGGVGGSGGGSGASYFGSGATNALFAALAMQDGNGFVFIMEL